LVSAGCRSDTDERAVNNELSRPATTGQEPTHPQMDGSGQDAGPGTGVKTGSGIDNPSSGSTSPQPMPTP